MVLSYKLDEATVNSHTKNKSVDKTGYMTMLE